MGHPYWPRWPSLGPSGPVGENRLGFKANLASGQHWDSAPSSLSLVFLFCRETQLQGVGLSALQGQEGQEEPQKFNKVIFIAEKS